MPALTPAPAPLTPPDTPPARRRGLGRLRSRRTRTVALVTLNTAQVLLGLAVFAVHTEAAQARTRPAWSWPLAGESVVDRTFQPPRSDWGAGHRGVDLRGDEGEWVLAAGDGEVAYSGMLAGKGVVVVKHANGLRTTYEPVVEGVPAGTQVSQGERIGSLAGTGHTACLPGTSCLHWGLLRGETYLDPVLLVTQGRLRLLPLGDPGSRAVHAATGRAAAAGTAGRRTTERAGPLLTTAQADDSLGSPVAAVAQPRKRAEEVFLTSALNAAAVAALAWGTWSLVARVRRRWRARRT